jgi:hypothetical protein
MPGRWSTRFQLAGKESPTVPADAEFVKGSLGSSESPPPLPMA